MEELKKKTLSLCAVVEQRVHDAARAVEQQDADLARQVIEGDAQVDQEEIRVEEECLRILALYQPVAVDLRLIVAVLKINNDLERIGDMAVNMARKAVAIAAAPPIGIPFDLVTMAEKTKAMLRDGLDCMVNLDTRLAREVCARDEEVDLKKRIVREQVEELLQSEPERAPVLLKILAVSRNLERIADLATNIAEDVIYIAEGDIVRHGGEG
jgi:phosphate transport system protein